MEKVTFTVESITPIFIAGADQKIISNEGLRAPSLKGLMRWWFRAIMGGMVSLKHLRLLESELYGDTNQKSKVRIISKTKASPSNINISRDLRYLWFSINMQKRKNLRVQCYPPKSEFEITIFAENNLDLKIAAGCFWSIIFLGGIGSRMRRGAGSLKIKRVSNNIPNDFFFNGTTIYDAKMFIENNLKKIFKNFKEYANEKYNSQQNLTFSVLSNKHAKIVLFNKEFTTFEKALQEVGDIYKTFRQNKRLEHRTKFGLPIIPRFSDLRFASPLFIGVMDLNGKYIARLVKFYTSTHPKFSSNLRFLERDLNDLDAKLDELNIEIPEVF